MNAGSLSLFKYFIMKGAILVKVFIILPLILLADYIIMAALGCSTCLFGLGDEFYCGPFCIAGKIVLALSVVFFGYLIYRDVRKYRKPVQDGQAAKEQKNL